jgi:hypothetical protein
VKHQSHVYRHINIGNILDYLYGPNLERGAIPKIARDTSIPEPTLRDGHHHNVAKENWFLLVEGHPRAQGPNLECEAAIAGLFVITIFNSGSA